MKRKVSYIIQNHGHGAWYDVEEDGNLVRAKHTAKDSAEVTGEDHRVVRLVIDPSFKPIIFKGKK